MDLRNLPRLTFVAAFFQGARGNPRSRRRRISGLIIAVTLVASLLPLLPVAQAQTATGTPRATATAAQPYQSGGGGESANKVRVIPALVLPENGSPLVEPAPAVDVEPPAPGMTDEGIVAKQRAERGELDVTTKVQAALAGEARAAATGKPVTADITPQAFLGGSFTAVTNNGWRPPDPTLAVGPYNLAAMANGNVNLYRKNGALISSQSLQGFFGTPDGQTFDPWAVYDPYINRFWLMAVSCNQVGTTACSGGTPLRSTIWIALSNTDDVTQGWGVFALDARFDGGTQTNNWCDYPKLAYDAVAIVVTCNMFAFGGGFQYAKIRVMTKAQFMFGGCCLWWDFWNLREGFLGTGTSFTVQPANMDNAVEGTGMFLVNGQGGGGSGSTIEVRRLTNNRMCCEAPRTGPTLEQNSRGVGGYSVPPNARQPGTTTRIDTGDARLLGAVFRSGFLTFWQGLSAAGSASIGFTEFNVSSYPTMSTVGDWFFGDAGFDRFYAQVGQAAGWVKTMVYSRSAPGEFAQAVFVGVNTASTGSEGPEVQLRGGANTYINFVGTRNRWGDYSGASPDPSGTGIWIHGEASAATANTWVTQVGVTNRSFDTIPPTTTATRSPAPNIFGWNNQASVTTSLSATDNAGGSGVRRLSYGVSGGSCFLGTTVNGAFTSFTIFAEGIWNTCDRAEDNWGNVEATNSRVVRIDRTPPTISGTRSPLPNAAGWNNTDVTVSWTCADALSGVQSCPAPTTLTRDGVGQSAGGTAFDFAGNSANASVGGINIDKTPPTITATLTPAANANGWNNTDVTVSWTCADNLSGVRTCSGPTTLTAEGIQTVTGTADDNADNIASATVTVRIDKTAPTSTATLNPPPDVSGNNNTNVTVTLTATDAGSGPQSITYEATGAQPIASTTVPGASTSFVISANGSTTITYRARDLADNLEVANTVIVNIVRPGVSLTPASVNFGDVRVGTAATPQPITLTNTGNGPLLISTIAITGSPEYSGVDDCPIDPVALNPGLSCTITISFTPTATGPSSATLSVADNAAGSPHTASLSGNGTAPAVTLSRTSVDFGTVPAGTVSAPETVTLTNSGTAPLTISLIGIDNPSFSETDDCPTAPATLATGTLCTFTITVTPFTDGPEAGTLSITDDAAGSPHTVGLAVNGGVAPARVTSTPTRPITPRPAPTTRPTVHRR